MVLQSFARMVVCIAFLFMAADAGAQARDRAAGEALFRAGRQAADAGDWATACHRFEESNRLDPAVGTVFNLGQCREELGQFASAWQRYLEVVQKLPANDERVGLAKERARAVEKKVPYLALELAEAPDGVTVLRDGVQLGSASFGVPLPLDPGKHVVEVRAPGHEPRRYDVTLAEGETQKLALTLGPRVAASAPATAAPTQQSQASREADAGGAPGSTQRTIGFVLGGVGILALAASFTAGALALSEKDTVEKGCDEQKRCNDAALEAGENGRLLTTIANIAFPIGIAGLGVGTYLILSSDGGSREPATSKSRLPSGAVVGFRGQF